MKLTYKHLTNKFWCEIVHNVRIESIDALTNTLNKLSKTENNYWLLVDALEETKHCIKQFNDGNNPNYKILTPVPNRTNRKGFSVNKYCFELLELALIDEIDKR